MPEQKQLTDSQKRFNEQCFLLDYLDIFSQRHADKTYPNFAIFDGSTPPELISRLTAKPTAKVLMGLTPLEISSLVPKFKLYKVEYPDDSKIGSDVELKFQDHFNAADIDEITTTHIGRGGGVGVKSFNFKLMGTQPAEAENNIRSELHLHFQNLEDLVGVQTGDDPDITSNYLSLIAPSLKRIHPSTSNQTTKCGNYGQGYDQKYYRIKAVVGWSAPKNSDLFDSDKASAVEKTATTLYLTLVTHDIDFGQDGTINLKLQYQAAIEGELSDPSTDILYISGSEDGKQQLEKVKDNNRQLIENAEREDCGSKEKKTVEAAKKNAATAEEEVTKVIENGRLNKYEKFLNQLLSTDNIYYVDVPKEEVEQWLAKDRGQAQKERSGGMSIPDPAWAASVGQQINGSIAQNTVSEMKSSVTDKSKPEDRNKAIEDLKTKQQSESTKAADSKNFYRINYLYFGDILNAALKVIFENELNNDKQLRFVVGPASYNRVRYNEATGNYDPYIETVNLADVPISLNLFNSWFLDKVIKPQLDSYLLRKFINDAVSSLITAALDNSCAETEATAEKVINEVSIGTISAPGDEAGRDRINPSANGPESFGGIRFKVDSINPGAIGSQEHRGESKSVESLHHYVLIYVSSQSPVNMKGDQEQDEQRGVYHFSIGSDRGLVKNIKFTKADMPYQVESRITQGGDSVLDMLRGRYNVSIEMYGNGVFRPGQLIYIDPTTIGGGRPEARRSIAKCLGLGGYYIIKDVDSSLESGKFDTTINAIWVAAGDGRNEHGRTPPCSSPSSDADTEKGSKSNLPSLESLGKSK